MNRPVWEKIGWKSEGCSLQIASETRSDRIRKARHGDTETTAEEKQMKDKTLDEIKKHIAVTLANSGEFSQDMIGELLTHKDVKMTKRYSRFLPGTMKKTSNRAAELIQQHTEKKLQNDVADIDKRQKRHFSPKCI